MFKEEDLLPLSGIQHLAFLRAPLGTGAPRASVEENLFTAEGLVLHERAHSCEVETRPSLLIRRSLPVHSFRLGLSGQCDVVEFEPSKHGAVVPGRRGRWRPYPIEYKRRAAGRGADAYRLQLCAQAQCLEEILECLGGQVKSGQSWTSEKRPPRA